MFTRLSVLAVLAALFIMGCGGSSQSLPTSEPQSSAETEETPSSPSAAEGQSEPGGSLSNVGTITGSAEGTTFTDHYRVGPLVYGETALPEEVLSACEITDPAVIARSVFARGQVTISYEEGSLPTSVGLSPAETVKAETGGALPNGELGSGDAALVAFQAGGEWLCQGGSFTLDFESGESQTLPFWIIVPQILTNIHPRVPASASNTWYFSFIGPLNEIFTTSGPGATTCPSEGGSKIDLLFLYNRSGSC
jgi:hypothetical protein